jgi:hypothetical protein
LLLFFALVVANACATCARDCVCCATADTFAFTETAGGVEEVEVTALLWGVW